MYRQTETHPNGIRIVLASASPRRLELLTQIGIEFTVAPANSEPALSDSITPKEAVREVALAKAREIAGKSYANAVIIAADTVVVKNGEIFGKPYNKHDAKRMLSALSGGVHTVYTGIAVIRGRKELSGTEATDVHFRKLTEAEIDEYIATGEPLDKAGAYGIQGRAAVFVERIEG
ncbi:MAG: Maf family protein, partial [Oscillospiraceae bacterium]|nr:Maf family protein [Oscillospiraceae bacterium]